MLNLFKKKCKVCKKDVEGNKCIMYEGICFCCNKCVERFKKAEKSHVCEFC